MRLQFSVRTVVYGVAAIAVLLLAIFGVSIYVQGWNIPAPILNAPLIKSYAARLGASFTLDSMRIGCLTSACNETLAFSGLDLELAAAEPLKARVGSLHLLRSGLTNVSDVQIQFGSRQPLLVLNTAQADLAAQSGSVEGLEFGLRQNAPILLERAGFDGKAKRVSVQGIRLPLNDTLVINLDGAEAERWSSTRDGWFDIERVALTGINLGLRTRTSDLTFCAELPASLAANREALRPLGGIPDFIRTASGTLQRDFFALALVMAALLLVLKTLSVLWLNRWGAWLALGAVPAVLPFVLYFAFRAGRPLTTLLLLTAAMLLAVAVVLRVMVYKKGARWYQRWEPFMADAAGLLVLFPLLVYGVDLQAAPPAGPQGVRVADLDVAGITIEPEGREAITVPSVQVSSTTVSLPAVGRDLEATVESMRMAGMRLAPSDSVALNLNPAAIDSFRVVFDPEQGETRSLFARLHASGSFSSSASLNSLPVLRDLQFLQSREPRIAPLGFAVEVVASSPEQRPELGTQFGSTPEPVAANVAVDLNLEPTECSVAYRASARVRTQPITFVAYAEGDTKAVNLRSFQTLPGSPAQVNRGDGHVGFNPLGVRIDVEGIRVPVGTGGNETEVAVQSLGLSAMLPGAGGRGSENVQVVVGPATIQSADGTAVTLGRAQASYIRNLQERNASVTLGAIGIDSPQGPTVRVADTRADFKEQAGRQNVTVVVGATSVGGGQGPVLRAAATRLEVDRILRNGSVPVEVRTRVEDLQYTDRSDSIVDADFPLLTATLEGETSEEFPPRNFFGRMAFRVSDGAPDTPILAFDDSLTLNLNLGERRIEVPAQTRTLITSLWSPTPVEIPIRVGISGDLASDAGYLALQFALPRLDIEHGASRLSSEGLEFNASRRWTGDNSSTTLSYSGNMNLQLPSNPSSICLSEVSLLTVKTDGSASGIPGGGKLPDLPTDLSPCALLPGLPTTIQIPLSGVLPLGREAQPFVIGGSGNGLRVREIQRHVRNLQIPRGRLTRLDGGFALRGVQSFQGEGGLDLELELSHDAARMRVGSRVSAVNGMSLMGLTADLREDRRIIDLTQDAPLGQIRAAAGPILLQYGLNLETIAPEARFAGFHVEAGFDGDRLLDAEASASLIAGPLVASRDLSVSGATASGTGVTVRAKIEPPDQTDGSRRVAASVEVPDTQIRAAAESGLFLDFSAGFRVEAAGSINPGTVKPGSPILGNVAEVAQSLRAQVEGITDVMSAGTGRSQGSRAVRWDIALNQSEPGRPFLRLSPDSVETQLKSAYLKATLQDGQERSTVEVSGSLDAALTRENSALLLDLRVPMKAGMTSQDGTESQVDFDVPMQVVFVPDLGSAPESRTKETLWNTNYYSRFWEEHPSRYLQGELVAPVNTSKMTLGPVSIRGVAFPTTPLRMGVGYSDGLQLDLPMNGRALYGKFASRLQTSMVASAESVSMDMRLNVDLNNFQGAAIGLMNREDNPLVEDEFSGTVSLRTDGLKLNRDTVTSMGSGILSDAQLETMGASVTLQRSPEVQTLPGVVQSSTGIEINLLNGVLDRISKDLRLTGPPRVMTYKELQFGLNIDHGLVLHDGPLLTLGGLSILSNKLVEVEGTIRAHLGGPEERVRLKDLIDMMRGVAATGETD